MQGARQLIDAFQATASQVTTRCNRSRFQPLKLGEWPPPPSVVRSILLCMAHSTFDWNDGELAAGLRCYREGEFFTAHEHWEIVWLAAAEPEKSLLQAVIQVAAACHHLQNGNVRGCISLLNSAMGRVKDHPSPCAGIDLASLRNDVERWLGRLRGESESEELESPYPLIRVVSPQ
jgi:predicted metal-dependent hydrolase